MLQRVLASLLCLLGAAAIGLGIASATLWRSSDTLVASGSAAPGTTLLMTEPGVLDLAADEVTVTASAESGDQVVIALGRTADVAAWIGGDAHTRVTGLATWDALAARDVAAVEPPASEVPAEPAPAEGEQPATEPAAEQPVDAAAGAPDPTGSDLWIDEVSGADEATMEWTRQDGRWSILVATTGEGAGPATLTMTWPQVVTTPYLVPAVAGGSALLLVGLIWWTLLLVRRRRRPARAAATVPRAHPTADLTPEPTQEILGVGGTVPLTRRAIRELEEQEARRHQRERERTRSAFPARVPGPRPEDADARTPGEDLRGTRDAVPQPTARAVPERMEAAAEQETADQADQAAQQAPLSQAAGSGESAGGRARRESAVRWGRRPTLPARLRRPARADTDAVAAGTSAGSVATAGTLESGPKAEHPTTPAATGASGPWGQTVPGPTAAHQASASADAWRRAWGFPSPAPTDDAGATTAADREGDDTAGRTDGETR